MNDQELLEEFAQQVYLTIFGRRMDDINSTEGQEQVAKTLIWANLFLDELELEQDPDGTPTNWVFLRENDVELGTITDASAKFELPSGALRPVADEDRPLVILQDGSIISSWDLVDPNQITKRNHYAAPREQRATYVNQNIIFSRPLNDRELGGTLYGDIVYSFPRLASDDTSLFDLPIPRQLLVLGTVKNASLPDIVRGRLSPSYVQRYANLLEGAKAANYQTASGDEVVTDDFGDVRGVY